MIGDSIFSNAAMGYHFDPDDLALGESDRLTSVSPRKQLAILRFRGFTKP